jgi:hypothetical protein
MAVSIAIIYFNPSSNNLQLVAGFLLAFGLALCSYLIVGILQGKGNLVGLNFKNIAGGMAVFILVIIIWLMKYTIITIVSSNPKLTLNNPQDTSIWSNANEEFLWFNALYMLADEKLSSVHYSNIKNKRVKYKLLLFDCHDSIQRVNDFLVKFNRMRNFIKKINLSAIRDNINIEDYLEIAISKGNNIPTISFFKTKINDELRSPYIIIYINDIFNSSRPDKCYISEDSEISSQFNNIFSNNWDKAEQLNLTKLLADSNAYVSDLRPYIR